MLSSTGQDSRRTICDQGRGPEQASVFAGKVFLCILLACLSGTISHPHDGQPWLRIKDRGGWREATLAGLPTFCPMTFHLLASYSLMAASSAALFLLISLPSRRLT